MTILEIVGIVIILSIMARAVWRVVCLIRR